MGILGSFFLLAGHKSWHLAFRDGHDDPSRAVPTELVLVALRTREPLGESADEVADGHNQMQNPAPLWRAQRKHMTGDLPIVRQTNQRIHADGEEQKTPLIAQISWSFSTEVPRFREHHF
mmetsp:Transcript_54193/g.74036  ORF Transcript_54193/g.74036 Transcript_54193/m.74036 type:complete len:120 (+) Transcript_54193:204-563(+)